MFVDKVQKVSSDVFIMYNMCLQNLRTKCALTYDQSTHICMLS